MHKVWLLLVITLASVSSCLGQGRRRMRDCERQCVYGVCRGLYFNEMCICESGFYGDFCDKVHIYCPEDVQLSTDEGANFTSTTFDASFVDGNPKNLIVSSIPESGSRFYYGYNPVTMVAYDGGNDIGSCEFTVTVIDDEAPAISCPMDQIYTLEGQETYKIVQFNPMSVSDNVDDDPVVTSNPRSGSEFMQGVHEVHMTARDDNGNIGSCTFLVIIQGVPFNCNNGEIVSISDVCNNILDCEDGTDEMDCAPQAIDGSPVEFDLQYNTTWRFQGQEGIGVRVSITSSANYGVHVTIGEGTSPGKDVFTELGYFDDEFYVYLPSHLIWITVTSYGDVDGTVVLLAETSNVTSPIHIEEGSVLINGSQARNVHYIRKVSVSEDMWIAGTYLERPYNLEIKVRTGDNGLLVPLTLNYKSPSEFLYPVNEMWIFQDYDSFLLNVSAAEPRIITVGDVDETAFNIQSSFVTCYEGAWVIQIPEFSHYAMKVSDNNSSAYVNIVFLDGIFPSAFPLGAIISNRYSTNINDFVTHVTNTTISVVAFNDYCNYDDPGTNSVNIDVELKEENLNVTLGEGEVFSFSSAMEFYTDILLLNRRIFFSDNNIFLESTLSSPQECSFLYLGQTNLPSNSLFLRNFQLDSRLLQTKTRNIGVLRGIFPNEGDCPYNLKVHPELPPGYMVCTGYGTVVKSSEVCDTEWQCPEGEDEVECEPQVVSDPVAISVRPPSGYYPYISQTKPVRIFTFRKASSDRFFFLNLTTTFYGYYEISLRIGAGSYQGALTKAIRSLDSSQLSETGNLLYFREDTIWIEIYAEDNFEAIIFVGNSSDVLFCSDSFVVSKTAACDGLFDCSSGEDETECPPLNLTDISPLRLPNQAHVDSIIWSFTAAQEASFKVQFDYSVKYDVAYLAIGEGRDPTDNSSILFQWSERDRKDFELLHIFNSAEIWILMKPSYRVPYRSPGSVQVLPITDVNVKDGESTNISSSDVSANCAIWILRFPAELGGRIECDYLSLYSSSLKFGVGEDFQNVIGEIDYHSGDANIQIPFNTVWILFESEQSNYGYFYGSYGYYGYNDDSFTCKVIAFNTTVSLWQNVETIVSSDLNGYGTFSWIGWTLVPTGSLGTFFNFMEANFSDGVIGGGSNIAVNATPGFLYSHYDVVSNIFIRGPAWVFFSSSSCYYGCLYSIAVSGVDPTDITTCGASYQVLGEAMVCDGEPFCDSSSDEIGCEIPGTNHTLRSTNYPDYIGSRQLQRWEYSSIREDSSVIMRFRELTLGYGVVFYAGIGSVAPGNSSIDYRPAADCVLTQYDPIQDLYLESNMVWIVLMADSRYSLSRTRMLVDLQVVGADEDITLCTDSSVILDDTYICDGEPYCPRSDDEIGCEIPGSLATIQSTNYPDYIRTRELQRWEYFTPRANVSVVIQFRELTLDYGVVFYAGIGSVAPENSSVDYRPAADCVLTQYDPIQDLLLESNMVWIVISNEYGNGLDRTKMLADIRPLDGEFLRCEDGRNIAFSDQFCDTLWHCDDGEDEIGCNPIIVDGGDVHELVSASEKSSWVFRLSSPDDQRFIVEVGYRIHSFIEIGSGSNFNDSNSTLHVLEPYGYYSDIYINNETEIWITIDEASIYDETSLTLRVISQKESVDLHETTTLQLFNEIRPGTFCWSFTTVEGAAFFVNFDHSVRYSYAYVAIGKGLDPSDNSSVFYQWSRGSEDQVELIHSLASREIWIKMQTNYGNPGRSPGYVQAVPLNNVTVAEGSTEDFSLMESTSAVWIFRFPDNLGGRIECANVTSHTLTFGVGEDLRSQSTIVGINSYDNSAEIQIPFDTVWVTIIQSSHNYYNYYSSFDYYGETDGSFSCRVMAFDTKVNLLEDVQTKVAFARDYDYSVQWIGWNLIPPEELGSLIHFETANVTGGMLGAGSSLEETAVPIYEVNGYSYQLMNIFIDGSAWIYFSSERCYYSCEQSITVSAVDPNGITTCADSYEILRQEDVCDGEPFCPRSDDEIGCEIKNSNATIQSTNYPSYVRSRELQVWEYYTTRENGSVVVQFTELTLDYGSIFYAGIGSVSPENSSVDYRPAADCVLTRYDPIQDLYLDSNMVWIVLSHEYGGYLDSTRMLANLRVVDSEDDIMRCRNGLQIVFAENICDNIWTCDDGEDESGCEATILGIGDVYQLASQQKSSWIFRLSSPDEEAFALVLGSYIHFDVKIGRGSDVTDLSSITHSISAYDDNEEVIYTGGMGNIWISLDGSSYYDATVNLTVVSQSELFNCGDSYNFFNYTKVCDTFWDCQSGLDESICPPRNISEDDGSIYISFGGYYSDRVIRSWVFEVPNGMEAVLSSVDVNLQYTGVLFGTGTDPTDTSSRAYSLNERYVEDLVVPGNKFWIKFIPLSSYGYSSDDIQIIARTLRGETCEDDEFMCALTRECIPSSGVCDGNEDCSDRTDELSCPCLSHTEHRCGNARCVERGSVCSSSPYYYDSGCLADKLNCDFECTTWDGSNVINNAFVCDGYRDCIDGSDEEVENCECKPPAFSCGDRCISPNQVCDGFADCSDGNDESDCECTSFEIPCGEDECVPYWDGCLHGSCVDVDACQACPETYFQCYDFTCLPQSSVCDYYEDCPSGEDETGCGGSEVTTALPQYPACLFDPCGNGGICVDIPPADYLCLCHPPLRGKNCDEGVELTTPPLDNMESITLEPTTESSSPCASNPCQNGGTCLDLFSQYFCLCGNRFVGQNCEEDMESTTLEPTTESSSPCASNPCQNGGICLDLFSQYFCLCDNRFVGQNCEEGVELTTPSLDNMESTTLEPTTESSSPCASTPCQNEGFCFQLSESEYICLCDNGIVGQNCEEGGDFITDIPNTNNYGFTTTAPEFYDIFLDVNEVFTLSSENYLTGSYGTYDISWTITAPPGYGIQLETLDIQVGYDRTLTLGAGSSVGLNVIAEISHYSPSSYLLRSSTIWIHFTGNRYGYSDAEFSIKLSAISDIGISAVWSLNPGQQVTVESPNYPENYPVKVDKAWSFETLAGHAFVVNFTSFNLENNWDYVSVGSGVEPRRLSTLATFTGDFAPENYSLPFDAMWMRFTSDLSKTSQGFRAVVTSVIAPIPDFSDTIRLVDGSNPQEGRVEVLYNGIWGTVCDDGWDELDASVVCRQLGLGENGEAFRYARFGEGSGQIWLDDVQCNGLERSLQDCGDIRWGEHNCGHSEDAGVRCHDDSFLTTEAWVTSEDDSFFTTEASRNLGDVYDLLPNTTITIDYTSSYGYDIIERWEFMAPANHSILLSFVELRLGGYYDDSDLTVQVVLAHSMRNIQIARYTGFEEPDDLLIKSNQIIMEYSSYHTYDVDFFSVTVTAIPDELIPCDADNIPSDIKCDGRIDCLQGVDEDNCDGRDTEETSDEEISGQGYLVQITHDYNTRCGGTLINSRWVLTSTTCMSYTSVSELEVQLSASESSSYTVDVVINIPTDSGDYSGLSLVKLNETVDGFGSDVYAACLPSNGSYVQPGTYVNVIGWSPSSYYFDDPQLVVSREPVVSMDFCNLRGSPSQERDYFCTGYIQSYGADCYQVYGGPIVIADQTSGCQEVIGVVVGQSSSCGESFAPKTFPLVSSQVELMKEIMQHV